MRRWLAFALVTTSGCGLPDAKNPSYMEENEGLPFLAAAATTTVTTVATSGETPVEAPPRPRAPTLEGSCATKLMLPTHLGGAIGGGLAGVMKEASAPMSRAVCACVGHPASVRLIVTPDYGELEATTGEAAADACLSAALGRDRITRVHFGSDCIHCGPQRFPLWHDSAPRELDEPEDGVSTITLSFFFEP